MKLLPLAAAILGLWGGVASLTAGDETRLILTGDTRGYLSPCGCTSPMIGGIRRRASAIRSLTIPGRTVILDNGALVAKSGRQDQMKAETLAQTMADLGVTAINVGPSDALLGQGGLTQVATLSGGALTSLSISNPEGHSIAPFVSRAPFIVGGATDSPAALAGPLGDSEVALNAAVDKLIEAAGEAELKPVLMLQGGRSAAIALARRYPQLALIQYSSIGTPPAQIEYVGSTALATTGEHGKFVLKLSYEDGRISGYQRVSLGPEYKDDPAVSRFYSTYLRRVKGEALLDKLPRTETAGFAGSWSCMPCHEEATRVWKASTHRIALETLAKDRHDADPDCVSCHVVALSSKSGFKSKPATPHLAGVGCESCHGPALAHARKPLEVRLPKATAKSCVGCHNPENSPNFEFQAYWRKIAHR